MSDKDFMEDYKHLVISEETWLERQSGKLIAIVVLLILFAEPIVEAL